MAEAHAPDLNPLEREFLDASLALRRRREADKLEAARRLAEEAQAREEAERKRAEEAEAATKRQRRLSERFLAAAVVAGLLAVAALVKPGGRTRPVKRPESPQSLRRKARPSKRPSV